MNLKKNLLLLVVALFSISFVACSDDEDVTIVPGATDQTWDWKKTTAKVAAEDEDVAKAIKESLEKGTFSLKYLQLNKNGSYESTLSNGVEEGKYKIKNDSLFLSQYSETEATDEFDSVYALKVIGNTMALTQDVTDQFTETYEGVEEVVVTQNLELK